ncbi:MAG: carboxylating nicotinate-nucleotide diphosphorylase [Oscillospiraceae bacterium]|jgi:nicotinate-nucleotide pyrophosphorylase (carboxylating)|nr:carboxylating nicotinate-nucleotide diphosphorylase [Oscillospiraceae bacterium]
MIPMYLVDEIILRALKEDVHYLDLSCEYLFDASQQSAADLLAKEPGVMCGGAVFARVFELLDPSCRVELAFAEGQAFGKGDVLLSLAGPAAALLQGERTALNLLQHMCGAATATAAFVRAVAGTGAVISETRKTLPGLRALQKYAVLCGGGRNHRYNLSDGVMLKDNHIDASGSIAKAVASVRAKIGHMVKIEVETRHLDEVRQAFAAGADVIMLDNMSLEQMREAVGYLRAFDPGKRVLLEASGDIALERAREIALLGVDILSVGALTHSVRAANISMRIK